MVRAEERRQRHAEYMRTYRSEEGYINEEYKQRVLRRVARGATPNAGSMEKYDITLEDINQLRSVNEFDPIVMNVPMFLLTRRGRDRAGRTEADFVPDLSEVQDEFRPAESDEEVEQELQPWEKVARAAGVSPRTPLAEIQRTQNKEYTGKTDAMSIAIWMRNNPRQASSKRFGEVSATTTKNQFGGPNSKNTGRFYNFLKYLGDEFAEDFSLVLKEGADDYIRKKINEPRLNKNPKKDKSTGELKRFKNLESTLEEFSTVLVALREYPKYNAAKTTDRRLERAYNDLDRVWTETDAKVSSIKLQNPKKKKPVKDWDEVVRIIKKKYPDPLSKENMYISLYQEVVSRDDFASLFVDDTDFAVPTNRSQIESIKRNTLFIPNKKTRKDMRSALLVLVDYKTKAIYGTQQFGISPALTKRIVKYVKGDYLFGRPKMSSWVGKMLDDVGIVDRDGANISYLRRSYVSSALATITTEEERQRLALTLRHSPSASLKYVRELESQTSLEDLPAEVLDKIRENKLVNDKD